MDIGSLVGLAGVGVVVALVEAVKRWVTDDRAYPLIAVVAGVVWNTLATAAFVSTGPQQLAQAALTGVVIGLAASGLYSGARTLASR